MSIQQVNFDLLADQRYYHSIALRDIDNYSLACYWGQLRNVDTSNQRSDLAYPDFEIQHRRLRSDFPYPRGKLLEAVSASGDGSSPYLYDVFALRMKVGAQTYFIFAFPFAALARYVIDSLIENHDLLKKGDIQKVNLAALVQQAEVEVENLEGPIRTRIVGLQVVISGDPAVSSVILGGDNPLKSAIYQDFLRESIHKSGSIPDQCVLACELPWPSEVSGQSTVNQRKLRARMHMDAFGNFKFYVHVGGENFVIIPYLLQVLDSLKCLDKAPMNPLWRVHEEYE